MNNNTKKEKLIKQINDILENKYGQIVVDLQVLFSDLSHEEISQALAFCFSMQAIERSKLAKPLLDILKNAVNIYESVIKVNISEQTMLKLVKNEL